MLRIANLNIWEKLIADDLESSNCANSGLITMNKKFHIILDVSYECPNNFFNDLDITSYRKHVHIYIF